MISITIGAAAFALSVYYNIKMDNFKLFGNGKRIYLLWSANDHEIPDTLICTIAKFHI
jgi:hypothetical protein